MNALEVMERMESGLALAPNRKAWKRQCHDEAFALSDVRESYQFAWACDCRRCRQAMCNGGELAIRPAPYARGGVPR